MENYHILERIGEGSFGKVYRGRRKFTGQIVALKFVSKRNKTDRDLQNLRQEINILRRLNHCNIIAIMDSFETDSEICMVTEYGQGELFQVLGDDQHLPESEVRHITIQLLQALQVLHQKRIIHRDMKPQNILIGSKQQIKVCDFGFARAISNDSSMLTSIKGTPLYMAPELVQEKPYNCTVDLWSLGVILYELAVGTPPFYTDKIVSLVQMIIREPVRFPDTMSPAFRSFLSGLLTKDPKRRLSWPDILHHPFVVETPEELQKRLKLEQEFRQLPRFFTTEDHVPVDPNQQLKPSVERLRNSGEWKICDPQTGRQVGADAVAVAEGKQLEERRPLVTQVVVEPEALPQQVVTPLKRGDAFLQVHEALTVELKGKRGVAVLEVPLWSQLWDAFLDIDAAAVTQECVAAACSDMVLLYKALAAVMKNADRLTSVDPVLQARGCVHRFLVGFLQHDMAHNGACADLLYQTVRCCTMFTNLMNSVELPVPNYRDLCSSDVQLVTSILQLPNEQLSGAISRALKWLGSMLDRARSLTDLLEEVHASGVIEALCQVLASSSGQRSPGGTSTKAARDNGLYAVFALATFVHPDGSKWGPLHPFPAMTLHHVERPSANPTADVRHLYKLRVKIHSEVTTQLLRNGLHELLALLNDELKTRLTRPQANDDTDADDAEEPDQSTVSCVIKILLHACRSSSPLSRKIMTSRSNRSSVVHNDDIISILLALVQSGTLHDVEVYFAIEFLVVLMRRQVLTKQHVWLCAKALYPIFALSPDVGLLSASCTYFADVLEGGNMDVSALSRDEQVLGLASSHQDVWDLVVYGILSDTCRASILRLFQHQAFNELAAPARAETLQVLACYNVRAQGLVDAAVVLLLRIAAKAMSHVTSSDGAPTEHRALDGFVALFEAPVTWHVLCQFLDTSGNDLLSPWGLFCFLKLMRMIRETPTSDDATIELALNEHLVPQLVNLLDTTHMEALLQWPEVVGGGSSAVKALIHAIVKVLGIPFMHNLSDDLLVATQTMLYDAHCVDKLLVVLHFVFTAHDFGLDASVLELPISFLSRLVTSSEHFGVQFVQAHGMETIKACGMLDRRISSPPLVIDTLLILSQLGRSSPDNYACILEADLVAEFRDLVLHDEAMVRAKALNCIGNLCRHSTLFYDRFSEPIADKHGALSVLDGVVNGLSDADGYVRRFACFAIGNAAFHNDRLYHALRLAIPPLVQNLRDGDEKTRSNAAGALGNLVRNSDTLCNDMCRVHAPRELLALARTDPSVSSRRIVLFSLGNFCSYAACVASMKRDEPDFIAQLERLYDDVTADDVAKKNIRRILSKIDGLGNE